MDTPLIDTIKKALAENPEAQDIVEGFRNEWKTQIEDAFLAGMHPTTWRVVYKSQSLMASST